jgi:hypothetical protein
VQVDPIKRMLKPPGTKRSKLKCDAPLSNFVFKLNLRPYTKDHGIDLVKRRTSQFKGVCWKKDRGKWQAGAYTRPLLSST